MTIAQPHVIVPLREDRDGVIRIGESRVTLETLVTAFDSGATPEGICDDFPTLALPDVYAVVTWVLRHREQVDRYLTRRRDEAAAIRRKIESTPGNQRHRERIRSRRDG